MKKVLGILFIIVIVSLVFNTVSVFAFGGGFNYNNVPKANNENAGNTGDLKAPVARLASTIFLILQLVSIGTLILLGVKYMFSSANQRADYKKGLIMAVIGLMLVFGASTVASFVVNVYNEATALPA